jgi:succinate-semialdehyde dehydrogenase/glutarate-semialdehyde dehydrogenase
MRRRHRVLQLRARRGVAAAKEISMFTSINPATGETVATYEALDAAGVEAKIVRADAAFRSWRATPIAQRTALLLKIADQFEANKRHLGELATREMGKTLASGIAEVEKCVLGFRYYAEHGEALLAPTESPLANGGTVIARWLPMGPVLAVMPWNFPYWQVVRFLAPTILAGNVALLKHASSVQGCAAAMQQLVSAAGAPDGLFQNLPIKSDLVADIIADPRVVAVTLTGSEGAGIKVAEAAGRALKKVVLELGGSDPFIVMPSADLDEAAKVAVTARIQNSGQSCICAKRMIVHTDVYDAFLEKFSAGMQSVKIGDPLEDGVQMGPLSSVGQRDTVLAQVAAATEAGATLLFGGESIDRDGAWMTPGVLADVDPEGEIAKEEIFGPVAMVFRAADLDAAIALANDVPFGLGSSVWTTDPDEIERFARDVEAGMTAVNAMLASTPEAPFGGVKRSGHGRELGQWGLHEFMNLKAVMLAKGA